MAGQEHGGDWKEASIEGHEVLPKVRNATRRKNVSRAIFDLPFATAPIHLKRLETAFLAACQR
jgi:hypothetical protein